MSGPEDGGPAFPTDAADIHPADLARLREKMGWSAQEAARVMGRASGMSLRDWFAGQALAGGMVTIGQYHGPIKWDAFAADCYRAADAMLAARGGRDA